MPRSIPLTDLLFVGAAAAARHCKAPAACFLVPRCTVHGSTALLRGKGSRKARGSQPAGWGNTEGSREDEVHEAGLQARCLPVRRRRRPVSTHLLSLLPSHTSQAVRLSAVIFAAFHVCSMASTQRCSLGSPHLFDLVKNLCFSLSDARALLINKNLLGLVPCGRMMQQ